MFFVKEIVIRYILLTLAISQIVISFVLSESLQKTSLLRSDFDLYIIPSGFTFGIWIAIIVLGIIVSFICVLPKNFQIKANSGITLNLGILYTGYTLWLLAAIESGEYFSPNFDPTMMMITVIIISVMLVSAGTLYRKMDKDTFLDTRALLATSIRVLSGLYFGWLTIATLANITSCFFAMNYFAFLDPVLTAATLLTGTGAMTIVIITLSRNTVLYTSLSLTIIWSLLGILSANLGREPTVSAATIVAIIGITTALSIKTILTKYNYFSGTRLLKHRFD